MFRHDPVLSCLSEVFDQLFDQLKSELTQFRRDMTRATLRNEHDKKIIFKRLADLGVRISDNRARLEDIVTSCRDVHATLSQEIKPEVAQSCAQLQRVGNDVEILREDVHRNDVEVKEKLYAMQENTEALQFVPIRSTLDTIHEGLQQVRDNEARLAEYMARPSISQVPVSTPPAVHVELSEPATSEAPEQPIPSAAKPKRRVSFADVEDVTALRARAASPDLDQEDSTSTLADVEEHSQEHASAAQSQEASFPVTEDVTSPSSSLVQAAKRDDEEERMFTPLRVKERIESWERGNTSGYDDAYP